MFFTRCDLFSNTGVSQAPETTITTTTTFPSPTEKVTTVKEVTVTPLSTTTIITTTQVPLEESTGKKIETNHTAVQEMLRGHSLHGKEWGWQL